MSEKVKAFVILTVISAVLFSSCNFISETLSFSSAESKKYRETQAQLQTILDTGNLSEKKQFGVINCIATNMLSVKDYNSLILFLTDWVEKHPENTYNAYWLLMTAYAYMETDARQVAEYYFERIINNYADLLIQGKSVHYLCLQQLIQISKNPANRITYFKKLIDQFANQSNITELYVRLAIEYENTGEWKEALNAYKLFLEQKNASTIQISGLPDAYTRAKRMIDFENSPKDWTFESLDALVTAVKRGISTYNYKALDRYKSKVNFFAMSWRQDENARNAQASFTSMSSFMNGKNKIRYSANLDKSSSPNEAFLRTTGWSDYVNTWYLYFRKVNFPADPEIHGRWEWAGIYFGEKF